MKPAFDIGKSYSNGFDILFILKIFSIKTAEFFRRNPCTGSTVIVGPGREKSLEQLQRKTPRDWSKFNQKLVTGEGCPFELGHEI